MLRDAAATKLAGPEGLAWLLERRAHGDSASRCRASRTPRSTSPPTYTRSASSSVAPIATFQAVSQRAADTYIDNEAVKLTAWQAAWRHRRRGAGGGTGRTRQVLGRARAVRLLHAAHHLHGGVGVDRDYPLYRYFLLAKQLELDLGSETPTLVHLGALIADSPVG